MEAESYLRSVSSEVKEEKREVLPTKSPSESIRFYYTGAPKEPVSRLEKISSQEFIPEKPSAGAVALEVPAMEKLLEDKLSILRKEIKDTLSTELEKRLSSPLRTTTQVPSETNMGHIPSYIQSKSKRVPDAPFEKIFPCEACGTRLRVKQVGLHQCPNCKTEVFVNSAGPTRFIEKLNL
jgi:hypothetical protein